MYRNRRLDFDLKLDRPSNVYLRLRNSQALTVCLRSFCSKDKNVQRLLNALEVKWDEKQKYGANKFKEV